MKILKNKLYEPFFVLIIIIFSLILFTPGNMGEFYDAEVWKVWAASKLLITTGKFLQNTLGPLYYSLLTFLSPFNYKDSLLIEYFITHSFFIYFTYKLIRLKNLTFLAILFPIIWIPFLAYIQSPKYILACGFLCLHLSNINNEKIFKVWFPPYLLCAILCNWGYSLFLFGHLFGKIFDFLKNKKIDIGLNRNFYSALSLILIVFFAYSTFNQLNKPYNNHLVAKYNYAPIPINSNSVFTIAFFQIGNDLYAKRELKESEWIGADWYFTNKYAFDDCKDLLCAIKNSQKTILLNLKSTLGSGARSLANLFFGPSVYHLSRNNALFFFIVSILIASFGLIGMIYERRWKTNLPLFCSIIIGSLSYIFTLTFTKISYRYSVALMPVAILLISYSSIGIYNTINRLKFLKKKITPSKVNSSLVLFLLIIFLLISNYKFHKENLNGYQFLNIFKNEKIIEKNNKTNFFKSYKEVFSKLNKDQKILSRESTWLIGFANVNPDKIFSIYELPPFVPNDNSVNNFLDSLDVITVSNKLKKAKPNQGTQSYLRYKLHLINYLEINKHKWRKNEIPYYGEVFVKK